LSKAEVVTKVNFILENGIKILKGLPLIEITKLKRHPHNIKKHPEEQIKNLMELMRIVGFKDPVVIDKKCEIKAGHGRLEAAINLGMTRVPYIPLEGLTKKQMDLFMYMDNQVNESPWIDDNVQLLLQDMPETILENYDVNWDDIITADPPDEEEIPEPPVEPISKLGDIYQLGNHRIMCGDSTKDLEKLINSTEINLLLTDPPYGISIVNSKGGVGITEQLGFVGTEGVVKARKYKSIIADDKPFEPEFLLNYGKSQIIFGANNFANKLPNNSHWIVWDKKAEIGADHNNFSDVEIAWTNIDKKSCPIYRHLWSGLLRKGDRRTELKDRVHPTQKPVGLFSEIIKDYSKENHTVLDPYLGSGSTLIACEQTNRICYGMELDPAYIDVIITRFINYVGSDKDVYVIRDGNKTPYSKINTK